MAPFHLAAAPGQGLAGCPLAGGRSSARPPARRAAVRTEASGKEPLPGFHPSVRTGVSKRSGADDANIVAVPLVMETTPSEKPPTSTPGTPATAAKHVPTMPAGSSSVQPSPAAVNTVSAAPAASVKRVPTTPAARAMHAQAPPAVPTAKQAPATPPPATPRSAAAAKFAAATAQPAAAASKPPTSVKKEPSSSSRPAVTAAAATAAPKQTPATPAARAMQAQTAPAVPKQEPTTPATTPTDKQTQPSPTARQQAPATTPVVPKPEPPTPAVTVKQTPAAPPAEPATAGTTPAMAAEQTPPTPAVAKQVVESTPEAADVQHPALTVTETQASPAAAKQVVAAAQEVIAEAEAMIAGVTVEVLPKTEVDTDLLEDLEELLEEAEEEAASASLDEGLLAGTADAVTPQVDLGSPDVAKVVEEWEASLSTSTMDIVFCASECAPWSKTGGLGDVVGSVPKSLAEQGNNVMVVAPRYAAYEGLVDTGVRKTMWCFGQEHEVAYYLKVENGVNYVFVGHSCFERPGIYAEGGTAYEDNQMRFTLFSLACCEAPLVVPLPKLGGKPLGQQVMFVANDWHTSMVPVYVAGKFRPFGVYKDARCCLAIHNLSHQGVEQGAMFGELGLPGEWYGALEWSFPEWSDQYDPETGGAAINFLKGGIVTCDRLLTVSEGYAWEITTPEGGWGLDEVIKGREYVLDGIVNGIDYDVWNPEVDDLIEQKYSESTMAEGKAASKAALQKSLGLPERPNTPMIGFIGRLDYQKGPDLIQEAIDQICCQDVQLIMLGSGDPELEAWMREAESRYPDKFRGWVGFSVPVSHEITAGSDILLMPSRFEPCGLNQLYAMRYGTVPVVHAAGGLRDTVKHSGDGAEDGTGFVFETYGGANVEGMLWALNMALRCYWDDKPRFNAIAKRGMETDFTWDKSATRYMQVFQWAMGDPPACQ